LQFSFAFNTFDHGSVISESHFSDN